MNALFASSVTMLILVAITTGVSLAGGVVGARLSGRRSFGRLELTALVGLAWLLLG